MYGVCGKVRWTERHAAVQRREGLTQPRRDTSDTELRPSQLSSAADVASGDTDSTLHVIRSRFTILQDLGCVIASQDTEDLESDVGLIPYGNCALPLLLTCSTLHVFQFYIACIYCRFFTPVVKH